MSTTTTTIDICLGASARAESAQVLLTVTEQGAADAIVDAITTAQRQGQLFQCDGLVPFTRSVERALPDAAAVGAVDTRTSTSAAPLADEGHEG